MKDQVTADKLVDEMQTLINTIRHNKNHGEFYKEVILKTGDVLGALEVFTFANFSDAEQEVIFSRARRGIEGFVEKEPSTKPG